MSNQAGDIIRIIVDPTIPGIPVQLERAQIDLTAGASSDVLDRLQHHKTVLESFGITDLSALGKLSISGNGIPQAGLLRPAQQIVEANPVVFQGARRFNAQGSTLEAVGGTALMLKAEPFPALAPGPFVPGPRIPPRLPAPLADSGLLQPTPRMLLSGRINVFDAYWAASWIDLADNTMVVFKQTNLYLTIICEKLTVGRNVTFTWERSLPPTPLVKLPKLNKPPKAATPDNLSGVAGVPGKDGVDGSRGADGVAAPELEMWALEMTGSPIFDLRGKDGQQGGAGQDGQDGGDGADGRPALIDFQFGLITICKSGPGNGGDGGRGGDAGNGGPGGNGGHGGQLTLYAPQTVLNAYAQGFSASADGGAAGPGGIPGVPGAGGQGGQVGDNPHNCSTSDQRRAGSAGAQGQAGAQGAAGVPGEKYERPFSFMPIDADMFRRKLLEPAVIRLDPPEAHAGDTITVTGLRFTADDVVLLDDAPCQTQVQSDQKLTFAVPLALGGRRKIEVKQTDGTLSNKATLTVLPLVDTFPRRTRFRPGARVRLTGSGFQPGSRVRVNEQEMPDVQFIDPGTLEFTLIRPAVVTPNAAGEKVTLKVVLPEGRESNEISVVLDTYRIVVFGDSVAWGQGLQESEKIQALVSQAVQRFEGNMGVYTESAAHSGAVIGSGDNHQEAARFGEVPTSYPTILQQVAGFTNDPDSVDLIIMNGGINDIDVRNILSPFTKEDDLSQLIELHCRTHMTELLANVTNTFKQAKVMVLGYYPMLSEDSNLALLDAFLMSLGIIVDFAGGRIGPGLLSADLKNTLVSRCKQFYEQSEMDLQAAIDATNASLIRGGESAARVFLAAPEFGPGNSALASEAYIYGVNLDLSPEDVQVAGSRITPCHDAHPQSGDAADLETCLRASVGHPNPKGTRQYAAEIIALLRPATFPAGFLWGAATAGYQVEGSIENNDWYIFTTSRAIHERVKDLGAAVGLTYDIEPAGEAVRHCNLDELRADLDRVKLLGMNAYRFSIEWSRIQPTQTVFDPAAMDYYDQAIDEMRLRGLKPIVTLNHLTLPDWVLTPPRESSILSAINLPTAVEDDAFRGSLKGWEDSRTVTAFITYVNVVVGRLKNKVDTWITLNEPVGSMIGVGYLGGIWPPGFSLDGARAQKAYFNLLKAHVQAYDAIKGIYRGQPSRVGIAHAMLFARLTNAGAGIGSINENAREQFEYFYNQHILDALTSGQVDTAISFNPSNRANVSAQTFYNLPAGQPWTSRLDFIGINYYRSVYVVYDAILGLAAGFSGGKFDNNLATSGEKHHLINDLGWEVYPRGLYHIVKQVYAAYGLPIIITENGMPQTVDRNRAAYIVSHLQQLARAIQEGVQVDGYLHWSIVDNFEWQENYHPQARFGLFTIDRDTVDGNGIKPLARHITEAALAIQYVIAENGIGQAAEKFGIISPKGYATSAPFQSPGATWEGAFEDGSHFTLYLTPLQSGPGWLGNIFLREQKVWQRLEQIQVNGRRLRFTHRGTGGAARAYDLTSNNNQLLGTYIENGARKNVQADRRTLSGNWRITAAGAAAFPGDLHLQQLEGDFDTLGGKVLSGGRATNWVACESVRWDGQQLIFDLGNDGQFKGNFTGLEEKITGVLNAAAGGAGIPWSAERLPDDIPL